MTTDLSQSLEESKLVKNTQKYNGPAVLGFFIHVLLISGNNTA